MGELARVHRFELPHGFLRLDNGKLLATMQYGNGSLPGNPGGLAKFDSETYLMSVVSAADPAFEGEHIRPYAVEAIPSLRRIVTISRTINIFTVQGADVVQIWLLSDLALLLTTYSSRAKGGGGQ